MSELVKIFVDGACSMNPGPGGWGVVMRYKDIEKTFSGAEKLTTNNRMELMAAIQGLKLLKKACKVVIVTDSKYVKDGMTVWIHKWKQNNWQTSDKKAVKNEDLWQELDKQVMLHEVTWEWIKGHSGHPENDKADELARLAIKTLK